MRILASLLAMLAAWPAFAVEIALTTKGGDAWTFSKRLEAVVTDGRCDEVRLASPAGSIVAQRSGGTYAAVVPLREGVNPVHATCMVEGREIAMSKPQNWTQRLVDRPTARIRLRIADGKKLLLDGGASQQASSAAALIRFDWGELGQGKRLEILAPAKDGEYRVTLRVTDAQGKTDQSSIRYRVRNGQASEIDSDERPAWVDEAVVYGVIPGLFGPRGLADVTARLDAIAATGANTVWLSPITEAPDDDFGYAVSDHFRVRARFGSAQDLKALVTAAHKRGLRVIMDFVPNHLSDRHPYHADAAKHGAASAYAGWFQRDAKGGIANYFDWSNLKNLDYDNPEVRCMMIEAFAYWVREFGIDGFRADAAWGVRERAPEFWREWRAELKRLNPNLLLLAEATARHPWYVENGFDAAYDWGEGLGQWAWKDVFADGRANLDKLREALAAHDGETAVLRFLNNNDTGARFATRHGLGLQKAAAAMLFTLPGMPLIYTGDELAAAYEPYDEGAPLDWSAPGPLLEHYRSLAALRRSEPSLRTQAVELVRTDRDDTILAYRRGDLLVLVNFTDQPVAVTPNGFTGTSVPAFGYSLLRQE